MASKKYYKLGEGATLFVDTVSGKKVLPGQATEFTAREMKTARFKTARKEGHLVEATEKEFEKGVKAGKVEVQLIAHGVFSKIKKVGDKKDYLMENFPDLDEEEIMDLSGKQLDEKYIELTSNIDEDDDEDEDEDEDDDEEK